MGRWPMQGHENGRDFVAYALVRAASRLVAMHAYQSQMVRRRISGLERMVDGAVQADFSHRLVSLGLYVDTS